MIVVTRLNGTRFAVNPDLIERIHESPDTHLVTLDGAAYVVLESLAEVVELIADYRAYVLSKARDFPAVTGYPLSLVRPPEPDDDGPAAPHLSNPESKPWIPQQSSDCSSPLAPSSSWSSWKAAASPRCCCPPP